MKPEEVLGAMRHAAAAKKRQETAVMMRTDVRRKRSSAKNLPVAILAARCIGSLVTCGVTRLVGPSCGGEIARSGTGLLCLDACGAPSGFVRDMSRGEGWFCSELGTRDSGLALAVQVPSLMMQRFSLWVCAVLGMVGVNWVGLMLTLGRC